MTNEFKVRSVSFDEEKSVQEIEAQLLKEHEEKQGISSEEKASRDHSGGIGWYD